MTITAKPRKRIAVIGAGIAGLATAWLLSRRHEAVLLEANEGLKFTGCKRLAVQVTLKNTATNANQKITLSHGFNTFGNHLQPQRMAQGHDGACNG